MRDFDHIVVGGGVVGMSCAAHLAKTRSVLLLERHPLPGMESSSRNSGVIHAGIYYAPASLKATLCIEGRRLLYERCASQRIPCRKLGKLIVATSTPELDTLEALQKRGAENGVNGLRLLDRRHIAQLEPELRCLGGLYSEHTGIVDAHELLASYKREALDAGATLCFRTEVTDLSRRNGCWHVTTKDPAGSQATVTGAGVVVAAGLHADHLLERAGLDTAALGLRQRPCKGQYFQVASRWTGTFQHLVYPVPQQAGLGVHLTLGFDHSIMLGPDIQYLDPVGPLSEPDTRVNESDVFRFGAAARSFWPSLTDADLRPGFAGIRCKLTGPGHAPRDFEVREFSELGLPGLVGLVGIESPGLTASPALGKYVAMLLEDL